MVYQPLTMGLTKNLTRALTGDDGVSEYPSTLSNVPLWLDFSDSSTITLNGSTIASIVDKAGSGKTFSQATAAKQPLIVGGVSNGKSMALWDGTDDYLGGDTACKQLLSGSSTVSYIAVVKFLSKAANNWAFFYSTQASATTSLMALYHSTTVGTAARRRISTDSGNNASQGDISNRMSIVTSVVNFATPNQTTYLEGTQKTNSGSGLTAGVMNTETAANFVIGASSSTAGFSNCYIGEIVWVTDMTSDQRTNILAYLQAKYAL